MQFKKNILVCVLTFFVFQIPNVAQCQNNNLNLTLKGNHDFYFHIPTSDGGTFQYPITSPKNINLFGLLLDNNDIKFISEWQLRIVLTQSGSQNDMIQLIPRENYIKYIGKKIDFTFGLQKFNWGMADKINPTNNINPQDYTITGFEPEQIPILASTINYYPNDSWKIQVVYVPYEQGDAYFWNYEDAIPQEFFSKYVISDYDFNTQIPEITFIEQDKNVFTSNPDYSLNSGVFGGKLDYYSSVIDLSLNYLYDITPFYTPSIRTETYNPGITPELENKINQILPPADAANLINYLTSITSVRALEIELLKKRIHRIGGSAKTIIGRFGLWAEACYSITEQNGKNDFTNRGNDLFFVVGADFFFGPNDRFYMNVQYTGKWIPNYYKTFYTDYPDGIPNPIFQSDEPYMQEYYYRAITQPLGFQNATYLHGISSNLKFSFFNGKLKPSLVSYIQIPQGYDDVEKTRYTNMIFMPSIDYSNGNSLHFILGAYLSYAPYKVSGSDKIKYDDLASIPGLLNPYNNIYFKVSYSWKYSKK